MSTIQFNPRPLSIRLADPKRPRLLTLFLLLALLALLFTLHGMGEPAAGRLPQSETGLRAALSNQHISLQYALSQALGGQDHAYHAVERGRVIEMTTRSQGYTTTFDRSGMRLRSGRHTLSIDLVGVKYGDRLEPLPTGHPAADRNRVGYERGNVREWYINGRMGLQQGWTIAERPERKSGRWPAHPGARPKERPPPRHRTGGRGGDLSHRSGGDGHPLPRPLRL